MIDIYKKTKKREGHYGYQIKRKIYGSLGEIL